MSRLKFASEHVILDCVHFSDESKFNLFGCNGGRFVRLSLKKRYSPRCTIRSVNFGGGSVMMFGIFSIAVTGLLVRLQGKINATVYKEILKLTEINPCITRRSPLRHFFLWRVLLLWSALLKTQTWILLRMFRSYRMKELRKRIQETSKNYGLILKENGRKYPLMNARY